MNIEKIKKRDGRVVSFDVGKIHKAMEKAARAVNPEADVRPFRLMVDHVVRHIEIQYGGKTPDVEGVQDLVERTLLEHGHYEAGKAYILYRAERSKVREVQEIQPTPASLSLVGQDGKRQAFSEAQLRRRFADAAEGLKDVDIDLVVARCRAELHDGMKVDDLDQALVLSARSYIERDPSYGKLAARLAAEILYKEAIGATTKKTFEKTYRQGFMDNLRFLADQGRIDHRLLTFDLEQLAGALQLERDDLFDYLGFETLYDRYFLQEEGAGDRRLETPQAFWMRVAMGLALDEDDKEGRAIEFYDIMSQMDYVPSSPTLFHAGTKRAQMSSCYLNTVNDDLHDIFKLFGDNAQLSKYAGGIGSDWTNIRGTGAWIGDTNITSQGVIPFLRIANDVTVAINRSGRRRGATAAYLETWHYDIEDFLDLRRNTGDERRRTHDMNTANWIPDLFMKRVNEGGQWTLFSPDETPDLHHLYGRAFDAKYAEYEAKADRGEITLFKRMAAKDLWRKMITMLFETGHPWITFKDPSNVRSPQDHVGTVHNSNLCTEITLNTSDEETAVCNLGSINLANHMTQDGKQDDLKIAATVKIAMRMLDNVINLNYYPTKESRTSNLRHRPVGLGIMGFQDALYIADIDFDSDASVRFADRSMEVIAYHAILSSALLAKERGAYESFEGSKWDRGILPIDTLDVLEAERGMPIGVMRASALDWKPVRQAIKKYGMRNSNTMAIAPTATISNITGCLPCIEPIYKNLYVKSNISGEFTVINKHLVEELKRLGLWNQTVLDEIKQNDGSIADVSVIPPRLRQKYKEVFDIDAEWLIKTAAYRGKWIDQSQSLNIFFRGTSGKRLGEIYMLAWHMGLKTTYYLRTLAASGVEKSTVSLQAAVVQPELEAAEIKVSETKVQSTVSKFPILDASDTAPVAVTSGEKPKLCLIEDPDCEACQ